MAVTFVNAQSNQNGSGSTSIVVTKPTGLQDNDVLIASIVAKDITNVVSLPAGFTEVASTTSASGDIVGKLGYKVVTNAAGEGASYTFTFNSAKAAASITAYRGLNTSSPISVSWLQDAGATANPNFTILEHPYRPHTMAFFILGGGSGSTTFGSLDAGTNPIVERADTTSSGGGSPTSKVSIGSADALVNPKEHIDGGGTVFAYASWYTATTTWSNGVISGVLVLNDAAASAIGAATTFETSVRLSETLVAPLQFTFDKQVAYDRHQMTIWGAPRHTPIPNLNTLDTIYEVSAGRFVALYAEFDDRWASSGSLGREQEGKAISFQSFNNYSTFGEPDAELIWGGQSAEDGSGGIDSIRFSDDIFVTYSGNGHTYGSSPGGGTYNYFLGYGPRSKIIRYNSGSNTFNILGFVVPFASQDKLNYLGAVIKSGPTTVTYTGAKRSSTPTSEYGAKVIHIDPVTDAITQGTTVYFHADNTGTHNYQTQVAHVDDAKVLFFYFNDITNAYVARVGDITNDVNGKPVVLTFSATINNTPNTTTSTATFPTMKPVALSETEGFYLHKPSTNTRTLVLQRYTVNPDDTVTFGTQTLIKDSSGTGSIDGYAVESYGTNKYVVATSYRTNTANTNSFVDANYIEWDEGANTLTSVSSETILSNSTAQYNGLHIVPGQSANTYHIKYAFSNDTTRPLFSTFNGPSSQINASPQSAYIHIGDPTPIAGTQPLFIRSAEAISDSQGAFIVAAGVPETSDTDLFVSGWASSTSIKLAYITYPERLSDAQTCFLVGEDYLVPQPAYIVAVPFVESGPQPGYVAGLEASTVSQLCLVSGAFPLTLDLTGGAIKFDKTKQQYGKFSDNLNIRPTDQMTVNWWFKGYDPAVSGRAGYLLKKYGTSRSFGFYEGATGTKKWHFGVHTSTGWSAKDSAYDWEDETWYMVTMTYDGANCKLYVDGMPNDSFAKTGDILWDSSAGYIAYRPSSGLYANMSFADYDMWNYVLTDQEIEDLYHPYIDQGVIASYVAGRDFEVAYGIRSSYIVSNFEPVNPGTIDAPGQMCVIAFASNFDSQSCYLVAGDVSSDNKHDLKIVIDSFGTSRYDLAIRIGGQGEGLFQDLLGEIEYPITRDSNRILDNLFFSDMPGEIFAEQQCFLHAGWSYDTVLGDLSGTDDTISPSLRRAYIPGVIFGVNFVQVYVHGDFDPISGSQNCYIQNDADYFTLSAYIHSNDPVDVDSAQAAFISTQVLSNEEFVSAYTTAWDLISGSTEALILGPQMSVSMMRAFVHGDVVADTGQVVGTSGYIPGSALATDPALYLYMFGVYIEEGSQLCFVHVQPTTESGTGAYIAAPWPFITRQEQLIWVHGNQPIMGSQSSFIAAELNEYGSANAYMAGLVARSSQKHMYVVNNIIYTINNSKKSYIRVVEGVAASSKGCFISSGQHTGAVHAFIANLDSLDSMVDKKNCFIHSGDISDTDQLAFIFGAYIITDDDFQNLAAYIEGDV